MLAKKRPDAARLPPKNWNGRGSRSQAASAVASVVTATTTPANGALQLAADSRGTVYFVWNP